jgi:hypothetical protein
MDLPPHRARGDALPALGTEQNDNDERHTRWIIQPEVLLHRASGASLYLVDTREEIQNLVIDDI